MRDRSEIEHQSKKEEGDSPDDSAHPTINRWFALVEITRLLVNSGHPNLALAAICVLAIPLAAIAALVVALLHG